MSDYFFSQFPVVWPIAVFASDVEFNFELFFFSDIRVISKYHWVIDYFTGKAFIRAFRSKNILLSFLLKQFDKYKD